MQRYVSSVRIRTLLSAAAIVFVLGASTRVSAQSSIPPYFMVLVDTSGSMAWPSSGTGNNSCNTPRSRINDAKCVLQRVFAGYGDVWWGLSTFRNPNCTSGTCTSFCADNPDPLSNGNPSQLCNCSCSTPNCSSSNGGIVLVPIGPESVGQAFNWVDYECTDCRTGIGTTPNSAAGVELRVGGSTPIAGSLRTVRTYFEGRNADFPSPLTMADPTGCRTVNVILITDGDNSCGNTVDAATELRTTVVPGVGTFNIRTYVIGFGTFTPPYAPLENIANAGGTCANRVNGDADCTDSGERAAYYATDEQSLALAFSQIIASSIRFEVCDGVDNDCDTRADEGFTLYCNRFGAPPTTTPTPGICAPPAEMCNNLDDNCNGTVDEGVRNACGTCGPTPLEACNRLDDDCDGGIDEGVCGGCIPSTEICDNRDNDCDGTIDMITRACGTDQGECTAGMQTCVAGAWGMCSGRGPLPEICNNLDDDCNGVIDGQVSSCGVDTGACQSGSRVCTNGVQGMCIGEITPVAEICNSVDDDCDTRTDEGNPGGGASCGISLGVCTPGTLQCVGGALDCVGDTSGGPEACNNTDDDCDGRSDEGNPGGGAQCGVSNVGRCRFGAQTCTAGMLSCQGQVLPTAEICNGLDDDCDSRTDEGNPGGGAACGDSTGECSPGMLTCQGGTLACVGGQGPVAETCNRLDDDCDGAIDDGIASTGPCGIDTGECARGNLLCNPMTGMMECFGAVGPATESCNNRDDDCDTRTDEGNPGGGAVCGDATGECSTGNLTCQAGVLACLGGQGPRAETCNMLDDDCDGVVDDGIAPGGPCGSDLGECTRGNLICNPATGMMSCVGQIGPGTEVCNGLDDDCDTRTDEGNPGGGAVCGDDTGECSTGTLACQSGRLTCAGGQGPRAETCNSRDDDCNGVVDDGIPPGAACGTDTGECTRGNLLCNAMTGMQECVGSVGPTTETCNGLDDDCDSRTDEGNPGGGGVCGEDTGECRTGTFQCQAGVLACVGGQGPITEVCNTRDDDCNGLIDDGIPPGAACGVDTGECVRGNLVCNPSTGMEECSGSVGPTTERCNGLDDDCDSRTDENNPGGGGACGRDTGECQSGSFVCTGGVLACQGEIEPATEVCNRLDDDCDGIVDNGIPPGAACGIDTGECAQGNLVCDPATGTETCQGAVGPTTETCNARDDDCDAMTDEGNPGGGAACGDDTGECMPGTQACRAGMLVCENAIGPVPEICNGLDDDCDGVADDEIPVGAPCGLSEGQCEPGNFVCDPITGMLACQGAIGPSAEDCNALDDDCDAMIDEALDGQIDRLPPAGPACGTDVGVCRAGMEICDDGFVVCSGTIEPGTEICDCEDNDCDGSVDEEATGSLCSSGSVCLQCSCSTPCRADEFNPCAGGRFPIEDMMGNCYCVQDRCDEAACAVESRTDDTGAIRCSPDMSGLPSCVCRSNQCTFPCDGVLCGEGEVCSESRGVCVRDDCRDLGCPAGEICDATDLDDIRCRAATCDDAACSSQCPDGGPCVTRFQCRNDVCEPASCGARCGPNETCERGVCVLDRCARAMCMMGEVCDPTTGACVDDQCDGSMCGAGEVCNPVTGGCDPDPCTGVRCLGANEVCVDGTCRSTGETADAGRETDAGTAGPVDAGDAGAGGPMDAGRGPNIDANLREPTRIVAAGGGGGFCAASPAGRGSAAGALVVLLALAALLRRRGGSR